MSASNNAGSALTGASWREHALRRMAQPLITYDDGGSALCPNRVCDMLRPSRSLTTPSCNRGAQKKSSAKNKTIQREQRVKKLIRVESKCFSNCLKISESCSIPAKHFPRPRQISRE